MPSFDQYPCLYINVYIYIYTVHFRQLLTAKMVNNTLMTMTAMVHVSIYDIICVYIYMLLYYIYKQYTYI